jgi:large subunit ribosomal protein L34
MQTTYKGHRRKRYRVHGFLHRMRTHGGANVIRRRRAKGRQKLSV